MSRQERVLPSLGRAARRERDDRIFVVATEDTYVPKQYFEALALSRVRVLVLETRDKDSAPGQVVERLRASFDHATLRKERAPAHGAPPRRTNLADRRHLNRYHDA